MPTPFDHLAFLDNIGGDEEMMHVLLGLFMETAESVFVALDASPEAMEEEAYSQHWKKQMHLLRGSALNVGADELVRVVTQAEADAFVLGGEDKHRCLQQVRAAYDEVQRHILWLRDGDAA